ncbi:hypothetical protein K458DRAFT_178178 [Lentithecium fluviatile CBS 122367]|uniref:Lytic polysaccharide monooxygenase n=1 Tax=Lentithecium fluviatile CBS 122367 TaxID=1168545 RepID=A0A6G1IFS0_9PLEO|nr:hypothetical protein K458DRAFT_178178 [Lentithecium fluviatile CBS 122367]
MSTSRTIFMYALAIPIVHALEFLIHPEIGSCTDVQCPIRGGGIIGGANAECQVTNRTYNQIGLTTFPSAVAPSGENLTWTIGTHVYEGQGQNGTAWIIEKGFYLGTPPELHLASQNNGGLPFQGCAVFLQANEMTRPQNGSWGCDRQLGSECQTQLLGAASDWVQNRPMSDMSTADYCRTMLDSADFCTSACSAVLVNDTWTSMRAVRKSNIYTLVDERD